MPVTDDGWKLPYPPALEDWEPLAPILEVIPAGTLVGRIFFSDGEHPGTWNGFRRYGPTASRFDHQLPDEEGESYAQDRAIMYLASGDKAFRTCIAEVFQDTRKIKLHTDAPIFTSFYLAAPVRLLDLRGIFSTQVGANLAINSGPRSIARLWSQLLYDVYPEADGILYQSSMNGGADAMALYERGQSAIPEDPEMHRLLSDPVLAGALASAAEDLRYYIFDE